MLSYTYMKRLFDVQEEYPNPLNTTGLTIVGIVQPFFPDHAKVLDVTPSVSKGRDGKIFSNPSAISVVPFVL
jgi:hypothetical protein